MCTGSWIGNQLFDSLLIHLVKPSEVYLTWRDSLLIKKTYPNFEPGDQFYWSIGLNFKMRFLKIKFFHSITPEVYATTLLGVVRITARNKLQVELILNYIRFLLLYRTSKVFSLEFELFWLNANWSTQNSKQEHIIQQTIIEFFTLLKI